MGKDGERTVLCIDTVGPFNKNTFFKTVQHDVQLGVARNTGCTVGNRMPERVYYNLSVYSGINENLQLSKSSYHGAVRHIRLIVLHMQIRIK